MPARWASIPSTADSACDRVADDQVDLGAVAGRDRDRLARSPALAVAARSEAARPRARSAPGARAARPGAVLCEMPSASSSLMRSASRRSRDRLARGGARLGGLAGRRRSRARSPAGRFQQLAELALDAAQLGGHDRDVDQHQRQRRRCRRRRRTCRPRAAAARASGHLGAAAAVMAASACGAALRRGGANGRSSSPASRRRSAAQLGARVLGGHLVLPQRHEQQRHRQPARPRR